MADIDERLLGGKFTEEAQKRAVQLVGYFVKDTVDKIFYHIQRLKIKNTGATKDSIKAIMHANSGGDKFLVQIWHTYYAEYVEMAVGKYRGIDNDLGKKRGVRVENIDAPEIAELDYDRLTAKFKGVPANARREETHRPRPFLRSEIRRNLARISNKLMAEVGLIMEEHLERCAEEGLASNELIQLMMAPFGDGARRTRTYYPKGGRQV